MLKILASTCAYAGCLVLASMPLAAQQVIHALTGTVSSIDSAAKTITVFQDNGTTGEFRGMSDPKMRIEFDKKVAAGTTAANLFDKQGAYAIVFYFGDGDNRTAVALKSLGVGPFTSTEGTVERFDGRSHYISVKDASGTIQAFKLNSETVAEGTMGVVEGLKFEVQKGDHVRVVSSLENGIATALFLRDL
jgi:DNA-binding beta-propeller fold protein YncE